MIREQYEKMNKEIKSVNNNQTETLELKNIITKLKIQ